jgi:hypothetical protein
VPFQGSQDNVAVVIRRPQYWLRHGASVLDNGILWIVHGGCVMPVVSSQPIERDGDHGFRQTADNRAHSA